VPSSGPAPTCLSCAQGSKAGLPEEQVISFVQDSDSQVKVIPKYIILPLSKYLFCTHKQNTNLPLLQMVIPIPLRHLFLVASFPIQQHLYKTEKKTSLLNKIMLKNVNLNIVSPK